MARDHAKKRVEEDEIYSQQQTNYDAGTNFKPAEDSKTETETETESQGA
jgi:hypothetical protein